MRCSRCRKEIPGIGKTALPPVVPVLVAFAGSILGLFNLTLGQDPANALPHWSPATGWTLALGSLAVASVLAWLSLVRRKCPECGCTRMLDPMEEESVTALERAAAVRAAVDEARLEWAKQGHGTSAPAPAAASAPPAAPAAVAPPPAPAAAQETADRFATLEKQLREELERRVRAEQERQSAEHERLLRKKLDEERAQLETRLRSEIEKQLHANLEKPAEPAVAPPAAKPMTPSPVTLGKPVTPPPVSAAKAIATAPKSPTPSPVTLGKPVTPPPVSAAKAIATSPAPATAAKPVTPAPVTTAQALASSPSPSTTPTPVAVASKKTALPAAAQPKVETAPLALMASVGRAEVRSPAAVSAPAPAPQAAQASADGHERAKRRARVILSDLIAYHRDELVKAAHADDPHKALGTLWRDAVTSYNEAAAPEIRGVTNYLEEELSKQLSELRQASS